MPITLDFAQAEAALSRVEKEAVVVTTSLTGQAAPGYITRCTLHRTGRWIVRVWLDRGGYANAYLDGIRRLERAHKLRPLRKRRRQRKER